MGCPVSVTQVLSMPLLAGTEKQNAPPPPASKKKSQTDGHVLAVLASVIRQYFVVNYLHFFFISEL